MRDHETQIKELNTYVLTKIAPSKIQGVGLFALRDIPKGEKLYADIMPMVFNLPYNSFDKLYPEIVELLLGQWPQIINGSVFAYPTVRLQAYINHSDKPNYDAEKDLTLKNIKAGEEITEDYRQIENYQKVFTWLK